jgi:hypothetical protein
MVLVLVDIQPILRYLKLDMLLSYLMRLKCPTMALMDNKNQKSFIMLLSKKIVTCEIYITEFPLISYVL